VHRRRRCRRRLLPACFIRARSVAAASNGARVRCVCVCVCVCMCVPACRACRAEGRTAPTARPPRRAAVVPGRAGCVRGTFRSPAGARARVRALAPASQPEAARTAHAAPRSSASFGTFYTHRTGHGRVAACTTIGLHQVRPGRACPRTVRPGSARTGPVRPSPHSYAHARTCMHTRARRDRDKQVRTRKCIKCARARARMQSWRLGP
jgi:hypothetical protein